MAILDNSSETFLTFSFLIHFFHSFLLVTANQAIAFAEGTYLYTWFQVDSSLGCFRGNSFFQRYFTLVPFGNVVLFRIWRKINTCWKEPEFRGVRIEANKITTRLQTSSIKKNRKKPKREKKKMVKKEIENDDNTYIIKFRYIIENR